MAVRLKNWDFIKDYFRTSPDLAQRVLMEIMRRKGVTSIREIRVTDMVRTCSLAATQDGFEACLILSREDLSPQLSGGGVHHQFEDILVELDKEAGQMRQTFAIEHRL